MSLPLYQVDAFTDTPYAGNPAAVCLLPAAREPAWMQAVAREMNLAETAFLVPRNAAAPAEGYDLRWFTPAVEVDLCGHATLASAHVLWQAGLLPPERTARFFTKSGELTATRRGAWIELDFPATPDTPAPLPPGLEQALGAPAQYVGRSKFDYLVQLADEAAVRALRPDHRALRQLPVRGTIVTAQAAGGPYDFVSRFFAPGSGIDEDPVTGSAHCCLTPFWAHRLDKQEFLAYQASPRGGVLRLKLAGDRVLLGGQAVTVLKGELL